MHYLDNASTTPVLKHVADKAYDCLQNMFANPSSLYSLGINSSDAIENAREQTAKVLGCLKGEVVFTSCGTESNNIAIVGSCMARSGWANHIVATAYEHPSVYKVLNHLQSKGFTTTFIKPSEKGLVQETELLNAITSKTALITAMHINNEIGSMLNVDMIAKEAKKINSRIAVHIDGVQAFGKVNLNLSKSQIDTYSVSGHKINAPKGVAALYIRKNFNIAPTLFGGQQENSIRPGTENTAYIASFGTACEEICKNEFNPQQLKKHLISGLLQINGIEINSPDTAHPSIVNFSTNCIKSEVMLHFLESKNIYVSAGSACSKGISSHTLTAMHLPNKKIDTAIRVSFGRQNTLQDVNALLLALKEGIDTLIKI